MSEKKYVFKSTNYEYDYNPPKQIHKFYQICLFKNKYSNKHDVRILFINELGEITETQTTSISERQLNKFIKSHRDNKYKLYSTYDLNIVDVPNPADILQLQSPLLNSDFISYDFAKF